MKRRNPAASAGSAELLVANTHKGEQKQIFLRGLGSGVNGFIDNMSVKAEQGKRNQNHKMIF